MKAERLDKAESEYRNVLKVAPLNLQSLIGMGQCYTVLADSGDDDYYEEAIAQFDKAIINAIAKNDNTSQWLKPKDLAAVYYSRGYAKVKRYENSTAVTRDRWLRSAQKDFAACSENDPEHLKAKRAEQKIKDRLDPFSPKRFAEKLGPWLVCLMALTIFVLAQYSFFWKKPAPMPVGYYVLLAFGSLIFIVAGLFLPQILKLKFGGLELEKSSADLATSPGALKIRK